MHIVKDRSFGRAVRTGTAKVKTPAFSFKCALRLPPVALSRVGRWGGLAVRALLVFSMMLLTTALFSQSAPKKGATIQWEPVTGAGGYQVELMRGGTVIINYRTQATSYTIDPSLLEVGTYRLRISTLDRNQEIASDSPWIEIHVRDRKAAQRNIVYIGAGWGYNVLLPEWNTLADNSPLDFSLYCGYDLIPPFGIDLVADYSSYRKNSSKDAVFKSLTSYSAIPGVYYKRPIVPHFDFFGRVGAGISIGVMEVGNEGETKVYLSTDFLITPSVGVRSTYDNFFADTGLEFQSIFYSSSPFFNLKPFIRVGVKF